MLSEPFQTYRVFIASPGDVAPEREIAFAVINELNKSWENLRYPARLKALSWEESVHAGTGKPEEVIKEQIPFDTVDILIAILWKKLGTPTLTNHPEDHHPYLSGTQQEIEESYDSQKRNGRPLQIMLYRKVDDVPANMPKEDREQFTRLNEFLDQFQPGGKRPALLKTFRGGEFKELLKRELEQVTRDLMEVNQENRGMRAANPKAPTSEKDKSLQPASRSDPVAVDMMATWLRNVKLRGNPFLHQDAEHDPALPIYFTRFPDLHTVTTSDLTLEHKLWFFFGKDGSGKTALRKFIAARGQPHKTDADIVCIEFDQVKFEQLLNNSNEISDFQTSFVQSIFEAVFERTGNENQSSPPLSSLRRILGNLSVALREKGVNWVLCLIDPGRAFFDWKGTKVPTSDLITPLFSLSEIGGYGFRYFLPLSIKDELKPAFSRLPFNYLRVMEIKWDDRALKDMLGKRMTQLSLDLTAPYRSLGELCDDEDNLSSLIDSEIASLAQGNPRAAIWLANRLIESHCDNFPPSARITPETWKNVKDAWWRNGENRILGTFEASPWRVLSGKIFYQSWELILPERSDRLLKCLISAKAGFRSKEELIQAGWKGEKNLEGISEKALSQAMLRMKDEIKKELRSKGFKDLNWIKSVRGRGYRLWQPNTNQEAQDGKNG